MKYPPRPLSRPEAGAMLRAARTPRDRAMIVLLWRGGLRSFEACALETGDLEEHETGGLLVHIRHGKNDLARFVGLDKRAADFIRKLSDSLEAGGTLLRTRTGNAVQTSHVRRSVSRMARSAGIARRVHPHAFRHTYARELHDEGRSVREIQVLLGHKSLETTQTYLGSIGCSEAVEATTRREW